MKHLLFAGPSNVGKTTSINRLAKNLISKGYKVVPEGISKMQDRSGYGIPINPHHDFYVLLEKDGKFIICYSWGDTEQLLSWLKMYINELINRGIKIHLIIMATRDGSEKLYDFTQKEFELNPSNTVELPLGRMVRGDRRNSALDWYVNSISNFVENHVISNLLC